MSEKLIVEMGRDILIKLSVSLSDGTFESSVSAPISEHIAFEEIASSWVDMMQKALAVGKRNANSEGGGSR